ncbi:MAG: O-methyltransferase [Clostridia bacterium]|nr:O-methyltransferase [Clostridia bacterium]
MNNIQYDYIEEYINNTHKAEEPFFAELREYAQNNHIYIVKPQVEKLLAVLMSIVRPQKILEVGTAIGYSSMLMLKYAGEKSCVTTIERDENVLSQARENIKSRGLEDRIHTIFGDATEVLESLSDKYDFVFIDAAKGQYRDHFEKSLKLVKSGGIILTDDVLYFGMTASDELATKKHITITRRLREYLSFLCSDERFETTILPIGDGVAITYVK